MCVTLWSEDQTLPSAVSRGSSGSCPTSGYIVDVGSLTKELPGSHSQ